ncbi:UPF0028 protein YchK [hydrothermal vent metagenome]|uniref:UPF0028 protein YchK n=1 Tax=hydrothermal vent metagenome TaxID=652676 RepID=A0A1W1BWE0_9ZZZZ
MIVDRLSEVDFSLVLSGGGALGVAHLGVVHDLESEGIVPSEIVGTSMGGIIGACMAIGMSESEIYEQIDGFAGITNWIKFSFSGNAIIDNDKIADIFGLIFKDLKMRDTKIPLKLITTNLLNGEKRVFDAKDDLYIKDVVLATMAIPGIFDEHIIDGGIYGDGFLCENLGVSEASYDDVLAVDVLGHNSFDKEMPNNFFKTSNVLEMFERSIRLLILNQSKTHISNSDRDIYLLEPDTREYKTFDFHKVDEIRELGMGLVYK